MAGMEFGGAVKIVTSGDKLNHKVADAPATETNSATTLSAILDKLHIESKYVLVTADQANSASILIGPNGAAVKPLASGLSAPYQFIDPAEFGFNDQGTSGLILYVEWGAASDRWFAARQRAKEQGATGD